MLKPLEDGIDADFISTPIKLADNLDIIPGRLSLQFFESTVSQRWPEAFAGNPQAVRIVSSIRHISEKYTEKFGYDYVLLDTSPSLGALNKISVTLSDYFIISCSPDIYSIYGIKNIGKSLDTWNRNFNILFSLLPGKQRELFPKQLVKLLGFTLYKAQRRSDAKNDLHIPQAHYNHAVSIPSEIENNIKKEIFASDDINKNIGGTSIIYTNNTYPSLAQKYHVPMWLVPDIHLDHEDVGTVTANRNSFHATQDNYHSFVQDLLSRLDNV